MPMYMDEENGVRRDGTRVRPGGGRRSAGASGRAARRRAGGGDDVRRGAGGGVLYGVAVVLMMAAGIACLVAVVLLSGCAAQAVVDEGSPRFEGGSVTAGSELTESSQYAEVRLTFDAPLEAAGNVADDLEVTLNGAAPDAETIAVEASVDGSDVVVRLVPTGAADGAQASVYYALYDGLVQVSAKSDDGGLAHVKAAGGSSNAVLSEPYSATVPTGIELTVDGQAAGDAATGVPASVTFSVEQFAQLRCCSWIYFGPGLPIVMTHNHEFARDLPSTCAKRIADTVNANYSEWLQASCDGAQVTVTATAVEDGQTMDAVLVEGTGADPAHGVLAGGADARVPETAAAAGEQAASMGDAA